MNWDQFKKNLGARYRFEPPAVRLDAVGNDLPAPDDDLWILQSVSDGVARLESTATPMIVELAKDNIKEFGSDAARSNRAGIKHGFLLLKVQVFIQGQSLSLRGAPAPGVPVPRLRSVAAQWTPWQRVTSQGFPPEVTSHATLQYRLRCDDPDVPLMIRFAATAEGGYQQELSGPSGVADQLIIESSTYYVSLSHPKVSFEIAVTGYHAPR